MEPIATGAPRILGVFAHPDDEVFVAGGTLAKYAAAGSEIMVVSATKGQAGQIRDARIATRRTLGQVRAQELHRASEKLGVQHSVCWDYGDGTLQELDPDVLVGDVVRTIRSFRPDVVLANKEENRELDVRRLRERGVPVWVTDIETVPQAVASLERMFSAALRWEPPAWLAEIRETWCRPVAPTTRSVVVPIWRDPWMVVGPRTFANDLVRRLGWRNLWDTDGADRYPRVTPEEIVAARPDCVLLPDEPYVFTADDGPEAFTSLRCELVSGRLLTWYGPSLLEARATALARP